MKKIRKILLVFVAIVCLISFTGCSTAQKINVADIDESNMKVRVDVRGGYSGVQYVTMLTNDNKVISYNGAESTEAYVVPVESDDVVNELMLQKCLEYLQDCESKDVVFFVEASDLYYIEMYIGEKMYSFTYGCAKNPYANILTEILLGYSQVEEVEHITPYPSQFREAK